MPLADAADLRRRRQGRGVPKAVESMFDVVRRTDPSAAGHIPRGLTVPGRAVTGAGIQRGSVLPDFVDVGPFDRDAA